MVRPAVLVVEVVGVLPHVGDQERRAAMGDRRVGGVARRFNGELAALVTSQAQPLPNWPTAAALKALLKSSTLPKLSSRAFLILPAGAPPLGAMLCQ